MLYACTLQTNIKQKKKHTKLRDKVYRTIKKSFYLNILPKKKLTKCRATGIQNPFITIHFNFDTTLIPFNINFDTIFTSPVFFSFIQHDQTSTSGEIAHVPQFPL